MSRTRGGHRAQGHRAQAAQAGGNGQSGTAQEGAHACAAWATAHKPHKVPPSTKDRCTQALIGLEIARWR